MADQPAPKQKKHLLVLDGLRKGRIVSQAQPGEKTRIAKVADLALAGIPTPKKDK